MHHAVADPPLSETDQVPANGCRPPEVMRIRYSAAQKGLLRICYGCGCLLVLDIDL